MNQNREKRATIAKETVDILEKGFYLNPQKDTIYIK